MLAFLTANLSTLIGAAIVAALFCGVCWKMYRDYRAGRHSCSCGGSCCGCPNSSLCYSGPKAKPRPPQRP